MAEISEKDFDRIEAYLLGKMSSEDAESFQKDIENDQVLKKAVEEQRDLMDAISTEGFKRDLDEIHTELYQAQEQKSSRTLYIRIAASVAILLSVSLWLLDDNTLAGSEELAFSYTEPGLPVPMSATDSYDFYDAMVDYKSEEYDSAISKWEKLLEEHPESDTLNYFIGAAHFNLEAYPQAETYLTPVAEDAQSAFAFKAEYMLFLSAYHQGEFEEAKNFGVSNGSPFADEIEAAKSQID